MLPILSPLIFKEITHLPMDQVMSKMKSQNTLLSKVVNGDTDKLTLTQRLVESIPIWL